MQSIEPAWDSLSASSPLALAFPLKKKKKKKDWMSAKEGPWEGVGKIAPRPRRGGLEGPLQREGEPRKSRLLFSLEEEVHGRRSALSELYPTQTGETNGDQGKKPTLKYPPEPCRGRLTCPGGLIQPHPSHPAPNLLFSLSLSPEPGQNL